MLRKTLTILSLIGLLLSLGIMTVHDEMHSDLQNDEVVKFFPTYAHLDQHTGAWLIPIHGWVYEPEGDSKKRRAMVGMLAELLGTGREECETTIFRKRISAFLVDNERGKRIVIRLGDEVFHLDKSGPSGHLQDTVQMSLSDWLLHTQGQRNPWLVFEAVTREGDNRRFTGRVQLLEDTGFSVVSDIDDTIKVSTVSDRRALIANTFLRKFQAVPGMASLYKRWADRGAAFHYVSSSPWQLYSPLVEFLDTAGFPKGSLHLKIFRWKDSSFFDLFSSPEVAKVENLTRLLRTFPKRRFVLIGDSGEKDPEVYGTLARTHRDQVLHIYIRNVTGEERDAERFRIAFKGVDENRWCLFINPEEIQFVSP